jgi:purine-binding chemotaxis protein CheW
MRGRVTPVVNVRQLFKLPKRDVLLTDQLIFAHTDRRPVALMADAVTGVIEGLEDRLVSPDIILPGIKYLDGVIKLEDGLVFIHNLGEFLSLDEEKTLNLALGTT